ncbi:hypothetical protein MFLAVUS_006667 [Mucor flavus]|uniref:Mei2-like C-terminal RNA recognition motif domain-containing protein n=1 Tax=Mucor flavus TaxID=439312 RepID=A0ABP9Z268_9FUNG
MWNNTSFSLLDFTLCPWQAPFHNIGPEDYDNPSNYLSDKPTRLISIYNRQAMFHKEDALFEELKLLGEVNEIVTGLSTDLTIVSYFKLEDAQKAIDFINEKNRTTFMVNFVKPCVLKKEHNQNLFITSTMSILKESDYREHLSKFGRISSSSEATISFNTKLINIEFDDERVSQKLILKLNNGIKYKIFKCDDDRALCSCYSAARKDSLAIRRPSKTQKTFDVKQNEPFSFFSSDPFSSGSDTNSTSTVVSLPEPNTTPPIISTPKEKSNELDLEQIANGNDFRTTFMIRNIPNKYSQQMLIKSINETHANTYDFLYLRMDFKNKCNVGYAFINFINEKSVLSFSKQRVGKKWEFFNSDKRCDLSYAEIQGTEALVRKFKNSQVMKENEAYRPKLFYSSGPNIGQEEPFSSRSKANPSHHSRRRHNKKHAQKS